MCGSWSPELTFSFSPGLYTIPPFNKTPQKLPRLVQSSQGFSTLLNGTGTESALFASPTLLIDSRVRCLYTTKGVLMQLWHSGIWRQVELLCLRPSAVDEDSQCRRKWHLSKQVHWVEGGTPLFPFCIAPLLRPTTQGESNFLVSTQLCHLSEPEL